MTDANIHPLFATAEHIAQAFNRVIAAQDEEGYGQEQALYTVNSDTQHVVFSVNSPECQLLMEPDNSTFDEYRDIVMNLRSKGINAEWQELPPTDDEVRRVTFTLPATTMCEKELNAMAMSRSREHVAEVLSDAREELRTYLNRLWPDRPALQKELLKSADAGAQLRF